MSKPFDVTEGAVADIEQLVASLARANQRAASSLVEVLEHAFLFLGSWPNAGHLKQEITEVEAIRFWTTSGYTIAYDSARNPILILCVLHGARDLAAVLSPRLEQQ